ncbi:hypothetical protein HWV62_29376 [Athelia sp. TMB]|nr:hypothetical protein HWV62_29376 [Athelia sp. TMB]
MSAGICSPISGSFDDYDFQQIDNRSYNLVSKESIQRRFQAFKIFQQEAYEEKLRAFQEELDQMKTKVLSDLDRIWRDLEPITPQILECYDTGSLGCCGSSSGPSLSTSPTDIMIDMAMTLSLDSTGAYRTQNLVGTQQTLEQSPH